MIDLAELHNRFSFHPADTKEQQQAHITVRLECLKVAVGFNLLIPDSREKEMAMTHLQETMMWANAAVAIHGAQPKGTP